MHELFTVNGLKVKILNIEKFFLQKEQFIVTNFVCDICQININYYAFFSFEIVSRKKIIKEI